MEEYQNDRQQQKNTLNKLSLNQFHERLTTAFIIHAYQVGIIVIMVNRGNRYYFSLIHDMVLAGCAFVLALLFSTNFSISDIPTAHIFYNTLLFMALSGLVVTLLHLPQQLWRYASLNALLSVVQASTLSMVAFVPVSLTWGAAHDIPFTSLPICWLLFTAFLGAPRYTYRLWHDGRLHELRKFLPHHRTPDNRVPVLIIGVFPSTDSFIRAMNNPKDSLYRIVGIIALKHQDVGSHFHHLPVLGHVDQLQAVLDDLANHEQLPHRMLLANEFNDDVTLKQLLEVADRNGLSIAKLPGVTDFHDSKSSSNIIQPVAIEDLLRRPQNTLERDKMRQLLQGRCVMVTGAGGTIGGELARQIASFNPRMLVLLDNGEFNLYNADLEMKEKFPNVQHEAVLADVRNRQKIRYIMNQFRPDVVFHAGAVKHVPIVESYPIEGILTNAIGTRNVADACIEHGVKEMILISTDKAVNPWNVMGATKRLAERYCQMLDLQQKEKNGPRFVTVRFGNVLGSSGSVVPLFQRQLAAGGPITITHPDMTRYFMTVREAVELVLQASVIGSSPDLEPGRIMVLEMGQPVKIYDLAQQMIRLAGLRPDKDVKIECVGLRPGEKLHEELFYDAEQLQPTSCKGIMLAAPNLGDITHLAENLNQLEQLSTSYQRTEALAMLHKMVPEYSPEAARKARQAGIGIVPTSETEAAA